jgi:predicted transcriptional regulator of viral defense system
MTKSPEILLKLLDEYELDIFTDEVFGLITGKNLEEWRIQLRTLIKNDLIIILENGKYCRHNFRDEYVIGSVLANGGAIAYWSALNIHGLTEQIANTVFVQTTNLKRDKTVLGVPYRFIKVKKTKINGIEKMGYGNHAYFITDREKTIIDCFDLPQYAGEFPGVIRSFVNTQLDEAKLIEYAQSVGNRAAIKRIGYLCELFDLPYLQFIEFAKNYVTRTVALFDNNSPAKGLYITKWGLRLNIEKQDIINMKHY